MDNGAHIFNAGFSRPVWRIGHCFLFVRRKTRPSDESLRKAPVRNRARGVLILHAYRFRNGYLQIEIVRFRSYGTYFSISAMEQDGSIGPWRLLTGSRGTHCRRYSTLLHTILWLSGCKFSPVSTATRSGSETPNLGRTLQCSQSMITRPLETSCSMSFKRVGIRCSNDKYHCSSRKGRYVVKMADW